MRRLAVVLATLSACGPGNRTGNDPDARGSVDTGPTSDTGATPDSSRVYAHNGGTLYKVDTTTFAATAVGPMTALGTQSLTDLAIDKNDKMVGITLNKLYAIDETTAAATLVKDLSASATGFTSLSYVPTDLNDSNSADILVSANDQGDVYQIDPTSGNATKLGSYGTVAAGKVVSSGDLIGVRGLGIYATVDIGTAGVTTDDYLAKIDPVTWKATPLGTGTGFNQIFGLGFWAGKIYGFTKAGDIIQIDANTGVGTKLNGGAVQWFGAGVSTSAPILQ